MKRFQWCLTPHFLLFLVLALCLPACNSGGGQGSATPTPHGVPTPSPTAASILLGPQPCPEQVQNPDSWKPFVQPGAGQNVEGVICGYLLGQPFLQAVVKVRSSGTDHVLDVHVFTQITSPSPFQIFRLTGLLAGEVKISNYNTLVTNQGEWQAVQNEQILHTLAREFKWTDLANTLVPVAFVGIYPDLTRYQAEAAQEQVNASQGNRGWQLDAVSTAQYFAQYVLHWPASIPTTVVSGGGTHDAQAVLLVRNPEASNARIKVALSRLELNTNGGIWEATGVATDGMALSAPQDMQQLTSPVQVTGSVTPIAGEHTTLSVWNTERITIGQKTLSLTRSGSTIPFHMSITYTPSNFPRVAHQCVSLSTPWEQASRRRIRASLRA